MATGMINCVAAGLGGFLGPALVGYQAARTHSFRSGFSVLVVALAIAGLLPLTLRVRGRLAFQPRSDRLSLFKRSVSLLVKHLDFAQNGSKRVIA